jgi:hypothetical protein
MISPLPSFAYLGATLVAYTILLQLILGPLPHGSWLRSDKQNQAHGAEYLPKASMLQAADSCQDGHFYGDESYGYWVQDFQLVLRAPGSDSIFSALTRRREPLAQLYGLIGLSVSNQVLFEHALRTYSAPDTLVLVADSCQAREKAVAELLPRIRSGYWGARLTHRPIDMH